MLPKNMYRIVPFQFSMLISSYLVCFYLECTNCNCFYFSGPPSQCFVYHARATEAQLPYSVSVSLLICNFIFSLSFPFPSNFTNALNCWYPVEWNPINVWLLCVCLHACDMHVFSWDFVGDLLVKKEIENLVNNLRVFIGLVVPSS